MFDTTIVLSSRGTTLATDSSHFTLRSNGRRIGRIPQTMIGQFIIHHGIKITDKAMDRLGTLGVPTTFLTREGRVSSRLCPPWKHNAQARIEQSRIFLDPSSRLQAARSTVDAKLANCAAVIQRYSGNHPNPTLNQAAARIRKIRRQLPEAATIDALMGHEGNAARTYYAVFSHMLRPEWCQFHKRTRRPPLDPINSLLSYVYAVLTNELHARIEGVGLDPHIGQLHGPAARRPALALDLIEPFRPVLADRLCLRLINLGIIKSTHFMDRLPQPGIYITPEGRHTILESVTQWADSCDEYHGEGSPSLTGLLTREVDRYAKAAANRQLSSFRHHYLLPRDKESCQDQEP